jgi:hypothetical protein
MYYDDDTYSYTLSTLLHLLCVIFIRRHPEGGNICIIWWTNEINIKTQTYNKFNSESNHGLRLMLDVKFRSDRHIYKLDKNTCMVVIMMILWLEFCTAWTSPWLYVDNSDKSEFTTKQWKMENWERNVHDK